MSRLLEWAWLLAAVVILVLFVLRYASLTGTERVILLLGMAGAAGLYSARRSMRRARERRSN